jgi:hypothetical protein
MYLSPVAWSSEFPHFVLTAQADTIAKALPRDTSSPTLPRPFKCGLRSTRRHAFASSSQPTWACCEERERVRLDLSRP